MKELLLQTLSITFHLENLRLLRSGQKFSMLFMSFLALLQYIYYRNMVYVLIIIYPTIGWLARIVALFA